MNELVKTLKKIAMDTCDAVAMDYGTPEGARKAWQTRVHGGTEARPLGDMQNEQNQGYLHTEKGEYGFKCHLHPDGRISMEQPIAKHQTGYIDVSGDEDSKQMAKNLVETYRHTWNPPSGSVIRMNLMEAGDKPQIDIVSKMIEKARALPKVGGEGKPTQVKMFSQDSKENWNESKHPRANNGEFTSGGGRDNKSLRAIISEAFRRTGGGLKSIKEHRGEFQVEISVYNREFAYRKVNNLNAVLSQHSLKASIPDASNYKAISIRETENDEGENKDAE